MKNSTLLFISTVFLSLAGFSQPAFDWTKTDCSSTSHTLFSYLDNEEVVIMEFVMGCSSCTDAATYLLQTRDKYAVSNPGKVQVFYMDYWTGNDCAADVIPAAAPYAFDAVFDHCQPELSAYMTGSPMPAVIIAAGSNHQVIYQQNSFMPADTLAMETAITNFFATISVEENTLVDNVRLFPNPATGVVCLNFDNQKNGKFSASVYDLSGRKVKTLDLGDLIIGTHKIRLNTDELSRGSYVLSLTSERGTLNLKLLLN